MSPILANVTTIINGMEVNVLRRRKQTITTGLRRQKTRPTRAQHNQLTRYSFQQANPAAHQTTAAACASLLQLIVSEISTIRTLTRLIVSARAQTVWLQALSTATTGKLASTGAMLKKLVRTPAEPISTMMLVIGTVI